MRPTLRQLFLRSFFLSATTIGGGFVILSAMDSLYVQKLRWLTREEMTDITALAQSAPGAVAVNASLLTGARLRGTAGAAVSLAGCILPPFGIMCLLGTVYRLIQDSAAVMFLLPAVRLVIGCILSRIALSLCQKHLTTVLSRVLFTITLVGMLGFGADSIWFLLGSAVLAVILYKRKKTI